MKIKNKINTTALVFLLIVLLLIVFIIYPIFKYVINSSKEVSNKKSEIVSLALESKELNDFKEKYNDHSVKFSQINNLFAKSQDPIDFIKFLEKTASDYNIEAVINLAPTPKGININSLPSFIFQISTKGEFPNVLKFLEKLEKSNYLININNVSMQKQSYQVADKKALSTEVTANFLLEVMKK
ncbi:MAG: hypothetical protein A3C58_03800 [Candidatus Staskawiczbacteria bacterium RIFCSPHIGHO2_02_FULL_34_10]|uniref:Uncharacterized protein n=1 Tax=Candidatus Staskawiczbacteria bacterium RIFCSPHIGHO2_02_FULL_34_10 TaxID=1802205 RepID=A0A1G2HXU5_9BACT|nr:MAG: hypothetical protein A3C58_03800 [Candidatus Staskawiczbacteria bacterium RIFCSPHIGHO2_02_FULL_34_10]